MYAWSFTAPGRLFAKQPRAASTVFAVCPVRAGCNGERRVTATTIISGGPICKGRAKRPQTQGNVEGPLMAHLDAHVHTQGEGIRAKDKTSAEHGVAKKRVSLLRSARLDHAATRDTA